MPFALGDERRARSPPGGKSYKPGRCKPATESLMRRLLLVGVATVFTLLSGGLAGACDGCGKGGRPATGVPPQGGTLLPPDAMVPTAPMNPTTPAAPQALVMPPESLTPPAPAALGISGREVPCPCGPCGPGGRGRTGYSPAGPGTAPPYARGACPCPQPVGCPNCPGRIAASRGCFPAPSQPVACPVPGCSAAAPISYPVAAYSTQYYIPDTLVQGTRPGGRPR